MNNKITVARMWYRKGKEAFFGLKHLTETFPDIEFQFHLIINDWDYEDEYTNRIDELDLDIKFYQKSFFQKYLKNTYGFDDDFLDGMINFPHFYHIIIGHYLRRVLLIDFMLTYEYDVIFKDNDISEVENCIKNKIPFGIIEPHNIACDKGLYASLCNLYQTDIKNHNILTVNPNFLGINAGFQGINLKLFDEFLSSSSFIYLTNIFDFKSYEIDNPLEKRNQMVFETQEQSFYSLLNQTVSEKYTILNPEKYYFWPCWDENPEFVEHSMKSKIVHFTGHRKSKKWYEFMDKYLETIF